MTCLSNLTPSLAYLQTTQQYWQETKITITYKLHSIDTLKHLRTVAHCIFISCLIHLNSVARKPTHPPLLLIQSETCHSITHPVLTSVRSRRVFASSRFWSPFLNYFEKIVEQEEDENLTPSWNSPFQAFLGPGNSTTALPENSIPGTQPFQPDEDDQTLDGSPILGANLNQGEKVALPKSPVSMSISDEYSVENSIVITQAITLRNNVADWAETIRNYPQGSHQFLQAKKELELVSMSLDSILQKVKIPLFRLPPSVKDLQIICDRVKSTAIVESDSINGNLNSTTNTNSAKNVNSVNNSVTKAAGNSSKITNSPKKKLNIDTLNMSNANSTKSNKSKKRVIDNEGYQTPPKHLIAKSAKVTKDKTENDLIELARLTPGMEEELLDDPEVAANQTQAPTTQKKKRIPSFFITPRSDFSVTLNILRLTAPSLRSKMSNKYLKLTVETEDEHRALSRLLDSQGAEFKTFNLKQDRPLKVVIRGLSSCTSLELVKREIVKKSFDVLSISRLTKFQNKSPMPLVYLQIANSKVVETIYEYTELLGTGISVESYRGRKGPSQCWRCQTFFHSSAGYRLPQKCVKCAGPHSAKECTLAFDDKLTCANCGGDHAANWRQCPKFPKQGGKKSATLKFKITPPHQQAKS
ncbi:Nucleic-acid-binding protein from transposon X-element [Araneus ventricosus]|uniref:Nucleic-acid-binding protein from transposon X-element n=1 Tax=Araneus ventricosus TaxID=182803 RepID=A0A4Y2ABK9_ARAVE|nr:Nucleic-acid-binding protein from transposon X-element [Araneus ventricosus]